MVIESDTRQQKGKHQNIETYLEKEGIPVKRCALLVGDYAIANDHSISVDTKQSVRELAMDIYQDHDRFRAECERAQEAGIQLVILVEETLPGGRMENWVPPDGCKVDPAKLKKAMITMMVRYGVRFEFCDGRSTGRRLVELLTTRGSW